MPTIINQNTRNGRPSRNSRPTRKCVTQKVNATPKVHCMKAPFISHRGKFKSNAFFFLRNVCGSSESRADRESNYKKPPSKRKKKRNNDSADKRFKERDQLFPGKPCCENDKNYTNGHSLQIGHSFQSQGQLPEKPCCIRHPNILPEFNFFIYFFIYYLYSVALIFTFTL